MKKLLRNWLGITDPLPPISAARVRQLIESTFADMLDTPENSQHRLANQIVLLVRREAHRAAKNVVTEELPQIVECLNTISRSETPTPGFWKLP